MFCVRFWTVRDLSILFYGFVILIGVGGCDSGADISSSSPPSHEAVPGPAETADAADTASMESPAEASQPAPGGSAETEQPALAPLPSPEELDQSAMSASDASDSGWRAPLPKPVKPGETIEPVKVPESSQAPDSLSVPPLTKTGKPTERAGLPPLAPPRKTPESMPASPFSGNPLREGADGLPASPRMAEPTNQSADVATLKAATGAAPDKPMKSGKKKSSKGKQSDKLYDPIAENGEIFVDWQKPKVALVISGRQDGYLEPCGCAGLERMKGGLTRRHSLFKKLRADGWPVVGIDCGGLVKGFGRQAELKFHLSVDAMQKMGYDAIALGKTDLRLPAGELLSRVASSEGAASPFLSANVAVFGFAAGMTANHRVVDAGGVRVGITSVLGTAWQKEINNADVEMAEPEAKLREILPKLKEQSDVLVLLAHATMEESKALAQAFPEIDVVVTGGGHPEPPEVMEILPGGTKFIQVGEKGMHAIVLGIYDDGKIVYQRVPLDSRFEDSRDMKEFMRQYQRQLAADGLAGLGIRQVPHPQANELGRFVGSKECESCHEASYEVWKKTGHADAWETLGKLEVPRTHDPECISCHVVGWHPTEYFPYESGFLSEAETPKLIDVGCESCHGPGEKHVQAESGSDEELQKKLQKAMVVTKEQAQHDKTRWCLNCHDLDNSPDFDFEEYWPRVEHSEDVWGDEK